MHTQNVNVKTAAQETAGRWGGNPSPHARYFSSKNNLLTELANIEGELLRYRAVARLGIESDDWEEWEDMYNAPFDAVRCIRQLAELGAITSRGIYDLVCSVEALAKSLDPKMWRAEHPGKLCSLAEFSASAEHQKNRCISAIREQQKPFGITVEGRKEYPEDDPVYGTYFTEGSINLRRACTVAEAIDIVSGAWLSGFGNGRDEEADYYDSDFGRDMGPVSFSPSIIKVLDDAGRVVLCGNAVSLEWDIPVTDPVELADIEAKKGALLQKAAYEAGWDNYETARQLRAEAARLGASVVDPFWSGHPDVTAALAAFVHPDLQQQALEDAIECPDEF
jgi:hypothetical protein